jgi:hypothetical protein
MLTLGSSPAFAGEAFRTQTTVSSGQNVITVDNKVQHVGYVVGDRIRVTFNYSATCGVVFEGLALFRPIPFVPPRGVAGELLSVEGAPPRGRASSFGSATVEIRFSSLNEGPTGTRSGLARFTLTLGTDSDCSVATGDTDGIDRTATARVEVVVTTGAQPGE